MLYRGSEVMREVAWVVFDEIHYMRDKGAAPVTLALFGLLSWTERGVVWEESIIMLPKTVHHVFLSATIPNAKEFADWICKTHQQVSCWRRWAFLLLTCCFAQPCHVVYTDYRPTPLQHYLFPANSDGIYLVVDEKSRLREDNFGKALAQVANAGPKPRGG